MRIMAMTTRQNSPNFLIASVLFFLICPATAARAEVPEHKWTTVFGTGFTGFVQDSAVDNDRNIIITGYTRHGSLTLTDGTRTAYTGGKEIFLAKLAPDGSLIWAQSFGSVNETKDYPRLDDEGAAVATDSSNNIYLVGYFTDEIDFGGGVLPGTLPEDATWGSPDYDNDHEDMFVAKFDSNGSHIWSKDFFRGELYAVAVDGNDDVVVAGTSLYGTYSFAAPVLERSSSNRSIVVAKLSGADGATLWGRATGGSLSVGPIVFKNSAYGIAIDSNNNVVVTGAFTQDSMNFGPEGDCGYWYEPIDPEPATCLWNSNRNWNEATTDIFLAKLGSADGGHIWSQAIGSIGMDIAYGVATDPADNIYLTGMFEKYPFFGSQQLAATGGTPPYGGTESDIFVAKLDTNGTHLWATGFGDRYWDSGYGIAVDSNGDIWATGTMRGTVDFGGGELISAPDFNDDTQFSTDIFALKLEGSTGGHTWSYLFGERFNQFPSSVAVDSNNNAVFVGDFEGTTDFGGGPVTSPGLGSLLQNMVPATSRLLPMLAQTKCSSALVARLAQVWTAAARMIQMAISYCSTGVVHLVMRAVRLLRSC
jgi:hypothetical protein